MDLRLKPNCRADSALLLVLRALEFHRVVDRDVAERFRVLPLFVGPHEPDAAVLVLVEPVYRAFPLAAEADVEDTVDPFHEVRVQLLALEEQACCLEAVTEVRNAVLGYDADDFPLCVVGISPERSEPP